MPDSSGFSENTATLILGSRKPVLFVEGDSGSLDTAIYRCCFPETTVIARGGCKDVIHSVVTMRKNAQLTRVTCAGIIDSDGRTGGDATALSQHGIETLCVSEIENLILLPSVSRAILAADNFTEDEIVSRLEALREAVFSQLDSDAAIEKVTLRYCCRQIDAVLKKVDLSLEENVEGLKSACGQATALLDIDGLAAEARGKITSAIKNKDIEALLKVYDNKGLLALAAQHLSDRNLKQFEGWLTRSLKSEKMPALRGALREKLPNLIYR